MTEKSFEEALEKIEKIVEELEEGDLPLKKGIAKFEEGIKLLRFCNNELKDAEISIQKIVDENGNIRLEDV